MYWFLHKCIVFYTTLFIFIQNSNGQTKTYGEILIYKDRYLHLDAKLRLSEKTDSQTAESALIKTIDFNESLKLNFIKSYSKVIKRFNLPVKNFVGGQKETKLKPY